MSPKNPDMKFEVGDRVKFVLVSGEVADGTVKAVIQTTSGMQLQIAFGNDQTASVNVRQVVEKLPHVD